MKTGSLHLFSVMFQSTPNLIFVQFELWHLFFWFPCPCESMKATKFLYVWCELSTVAKMFVLLGIWFCFGAQIWRNDKSWHAHAVHTDFPSPVWQTCYRSECLMGDGCTARVSFTSLVLYYLMAALQVHKRCLPLPNSYPKTDSSDSSICILPRSGNSGISGNKCVY